MAELALHSNIQSISEDDLQSLKGYYYYASHRLLKSIQILKEAQTEYNPDGTKIRSGKKATEYIFSVLQVKELQVLLEDLEVRLRRMFIDSEPVEKAVSPDGYIQGPLRQRGRQTKKFKK